MFQITHGAPDPARLPATPYSPGLERIVRKALAREREDRYQTLEAMHGDLLSLLRDAARVIPGPRNP